MQSKIFVKPELSVIIPTYRRPEKLDRALSSVFSATSYSKEIIVVDDCPEGSGFSVAIKHGARYVCKSGIDRGHSSSRNIGIKLALGEYISFLDDDDIYVANGIHKLIECVRENGGIAFGDYLIFNESTRYDMSLKLVNLEKLLVCNQIPVGAYVIQKSSIYRDFDPQMRSHEDWDFLLFHASRMVLTYVPAMTVMIDKTENNTTSTEARRRSLLWLDFMSIYARYPAEHLAFARAVMLQSKGIQLSDTLLRYHDVV